MEISYVGESHNGEYKYYLKNGYIFQENKFGREVGWICSYTAWQRGFGDSFISKKKENIR